MPLIIVGIDVGMLNMGLVVTAADPTTCKVEKVLLAKRVDITQVTHTKVKREQCTLFHGREAAERVDHFIQEHVDWFDMADYIAIEKQPPGGLQSVEQLLFRAYRSKARLIQPKSIHSFFNMADCTYEQRKVVSEGIASRFLTFPKDETRKHDIADAFCLTLVLLNQLRPSSSKNKRYTPERAKPFRQHLQKYRRNKFYCCVQSNVPSEDLLFHPTCQP